MSKTIKAVAKAAANPSLHYTEITVDGRVLKMVFDYDALANAEETLLAKGHDVNILLPMLRRTFSTTRVLFAASLHAYQPEIEFDDAKRMVTAGNLIEIINAVDKAWTKSMPEAEKTEAKPDPPQPGQ